MARTARETAGGRARAQEGRSRTRTAALKATVCLPALVFCGAAMAQDAPIALEAVTLQGGAVTAVGPDDGYVAENTTTGSKTNTPLREIPQSVSVVTRQQIDDRAPAQLEDTISYLAGVTTSIWGVDDRYDQFLIRGFDVGTSAIYRDGLIQKALDFSGFKIEPYSLERVEVLKGASSVLYGENEAGGMLNAVTKRPTQGPLYSGFLRTGSFSTVEAGVDVGGPIDAGGVWSYRLTGLARDGETEQPFSQNDRLFLAPALTFAPDDRTSLTVLANIQSDKLTPNTFLPAPGVGLAADARDLPRDTFLGEDGFDRFDADHGSIGYLFEHAFDDAITVRQNLRYSRQDTDYRHLYYGGMLDADTINRTAFTVDETATIFSVDNQVEIKNEFGRVENTLLLGLDHNQFEVDGKNGFAAGPTLELYDPVFGLDIAQPGIYLDRTQAIEQTGLYAQTQTKFDDRWILTLGGRQAWIDNSVDDRLYADTEQKDDAFTGKAGLGYLFDNGLTPYVSYSESFTTNVGQTAAGAAFEPSEAMQYEAGVKYQPTQFPGFITAALFDITKTNVPTSSDGIFQVQTGEVRHRGLELEGNIDLGSGLSMLAAYTYLDAEVTESLVEGEMGKRPARVPEHQASLWANQKILSGQLEGLSVGAGVRYVGESFGDNTNLIEVDAYTLIDAALRYERDNWQASVNASNLFDKDYYATCFTGSGCIYGEGRVVKGTLSVKF